MKREKNQQDATIRCLLLTSVSTCFGHHYANLQENKDRVTVFGVLLCNKRVSVHTPDLKNAPGRYQSQSHDTPIYTRHSHIHTKSQLGLLHTTPQKRRHG